MPKTKAAAGAKKTIVKKSGTKSSGEVAGVSIEACKT